MTVEDVLEFIESWREKNGFSGVELSAENVARFAREMQAQMGQLSFATPPGTTLMTFNTKVEGVPAHKLLASLTRNSNGKYASILDTDGGKALYTVYHSVREVVGPMVADQLLNGGLR
jgi:hypothetical protein